MSAPDRQNDRQQSPDGQQTPELPIRRSAVALFIVAIIVALGFVMFRDSLPYPLQPSPGPATGRGAASPSVAVSAAPTGTVAPTASPSTASAPSAPPTASPTPGTTPPSTVNRSPTPRPEPSSDRYAVLSPCPSKPDCWIYVIRSGDNLFSIARWFGVSLDAVRVMNPWTETDGIRAGQELQIPTPTR